MKSTIVAASLQFAISVSTFMLNLSSDTTLERKKFKIHIRNVHKYQIFLLYELYFHSQERWCLKNILLFHNLCNIIKMKRDTFQNRYVS